MCSKAKKQFSELLLLIIVVLISTSINDVSAIENTSVETKYYENNNGVKVSEKEYQVINQYYGEGYFENMSIEDYEWFDDLNIDNSIVEVKSLYDIPINPLSSSHSTASKKLTILKSCSTYCTITTNATWLTSPKVRSYDVIGARFDGTSLVNSAVTTRVKSSSGTENSINIKRYTSGFGVTVQLPASATDIIVEQKFIVEKSGTVYASYQHATKNISLATSQLFTIGSNGYGKVFNFYGNALGVFDGMGGVNITLN